jgi:hypothetical protein
MGRIRKALRDHLICLAAASAIAASIDAARAQTVSPRDSAAALSSCKALLTCASGDASASEQADADDRLDADRPHLPEAATAVGVGRAILESGYTFTSNGGAFRSDSLPEALLRFGVIADWFELRVGQNFVHERRIDMGNASASAGFQDLYLGAKFVLTEQRGLLPAIAVIPQGTVPTGASSQTAHRVLAGVNTDFAWDVVKDTFGIEVVVDNNQIKDELGGIQHQLATGITGVFQLNRQLELFAEWDAVYLHGGLASTATQQYAVGGLVYFLTRDFSLDARLGVGLNNSSNRFLSGVGFAVRF